MNVFESLPVPLILERPGGQSREISLERKASLFKKIHTRDHTRWAKASKERKTEKD